MTVAGITHMTKNTFFTAILSNSMLASVTILAAAADANTKTNIPMPQNPALPAARTLISMSSIITNMTAKIKIFVLLFSFLCLR